MNLIDEALKIAAGILIVQEKTTPEIAEWRMSICMTCEKRDAKKNKCLECGCFLDLKTASNMNWRPSKNRNEKTHCPIGKWDDKEVANAYREIDGLQLLEI